MNRSLAIFLAAVAAGLTVVGVVAANAQATVNAPVVIGVHAERTSSPSRCIGTAIYSFTAVDAQVQADLGAREFRLPVVIPCARIDAVDALLALPPDLSGKLTVQTLSVDVNVKQDATCAAELVRVKSPVDASVLAVYGPQQLIQRVDPVNCTRITQALVGAQVRKDVAIVWPSSVAALPLALEP